MKPIKSLVAFLVTAITLISLTSCQKEVSYEPNYNGNGNGGGGNTTSSTGTFKAKINGGAWQAATNNQIASIVDGVINITGISSNGQSVIISTIGDTVGTYDLSQAAGDGALAYLPDYKTATSSFTSNASDDPANANGKLVITKIDTDKKIITGTFEAKVFNFVDGTSYTITEGTFELSYVTSITTNNPSSNASSLKATIDGTAWQAETVMGVIANGNIMITGTASNGSKSVGFQLPLSITKGTYKLDFFGLTYIGLYNEGTNVNAMKSFGSTSGSIVITEHNTSTKVIKGTFDFKGEMITTGEVRQITAGSFNVTYQ